MKFSFQRFLSEKLSIFEKIVKLFINFISWMTLQFSDDTNCRNHVKVTDDYILIVKSLAVVVHCTTSLWIYCNAAEIIYHMVRTISQFSTKNIFVLPKNLRLMYPICCRMNNSWIRFTIQLGTTCYPNLARISYSC